MYTIIGIENVSYVSKKTNQKVVGTRLHLTYEQDGVDGLCVDSVFCGSSIETDHLAVGDLVEVYYNKYGRVSDIGVQTTVQ